MLKASSRLLARSIRLTASTTQRSRPSSGLAFRWEDPLASNTLLTDEEIAIQDTARRYYNEELAPRVLGIYLTQIPSPKSLVLIMLPSTSDGYRTEHYDSRMLEEIGELGFLGPTIDGYVCTGVSSVASGLIAREVERVDSGYRSGVSVQSSLVMEPITEFGSQ